MKEQHRKAAEENQAQKAAAEPQPEKERLEPQEPTEEMGFISVAAGATGSRSCSWIWAAPTW